MSDVKQKTFAEIQAENKAVRNNSDLLNLANALLFVEERKLELSKLEDDIRTTAKFIENGGVITDDSVHSLYAKAQGRK